MYCTCMYRDIMRTYYVQGCYYCTCVRVYICMYVLYTEITCARVFIYMHVTTEKNVYTYTLLIEATQILVGAMAVAMDTTH